MTGPLLYASILLSTLTDTSFALLIGLLLAEQWLAAPGLSRARTVLNDSARRRATFLLLALFTLAHLAKPWFLAASMSGSTGFRENLATIPSILSSTHQGKLWYWNTFAILLFFLATLARPILRNTLRWRSTTILSVLAVLLMTFVKAAASHAADDGDFTLLETSQVFHILFTAIWAGSILVSGFVVLPRLAALAELHEIWQYGNLLSQSATWAVLAVLITGVFTGDRELNGPLGTLTMTTWGKVLIVKILIVLFALALGGASRLICLGRDATPQKLRLFKRLLFTEALSMALILCLSGWLGNTSPAMSMPM